MYVIFNTIYSVNYRFSVVYYAINVFVKLVMMSFGQCVSAAFGAKHNVM